MTQKTNKIIVLVGIILAGIFIFIIAKESFKIKNLCSVGVEIIGVDPETGVKNREIPLSSIIIEVKKIETNRETPVAKALTDEKGRAMFKLEKNKEYLIVATPQTFLNYLYNYSRFPYKLDTTDIEGEFILGINLSLSEEAKRDIQRRNDLMVLKEALEKYKEKHAGIYPAAKMDIISPDSTTYQKLKPYLEEVNLAPFDPIKRNYYRYSSDGNSYFLIAYPEIDTRSSLEIVKKYNGQTVYLVGNPNLDIDKI